LKRKERTLKSKNQRSRRERKGKTKFKGFHQNRGRNSLKWEIIIQVPEKHRGRGLWSGGHAHSKKSPEKRGGGVWVRKEEQRGTSRTQFVGAKGRGGVFYENRAIGRGFIQRRKKKPENYETGKKKEGE